MPEEMKQENQNTPDRLHRLQFWFCVAGIFVITTVRLKLKMTVGRA